MTLDVKRRYVSGAHGSDSANGLSWATAFKTITHALANVGGGADIYLDQSRFTETVTVTANRVRLHGVGGGLNSGTTIYAPTATVPAVEFAAGSAGGGLTNMCLTGHTQGDGYTGRHLYIHDTSSVVIDGVNVANRDDLIPVGPDPVAGGTAVYLESCESITLQNMQVQEVRQGVVAAGVSESQIRLRGFLWSRCWQDIQLASVHCGSFILEGAKSVNPLGTITGSGPDFYNVDIGGSTHTFTNYDFTEGLADVRARLSADNCVMASCTSVCDLFVDGDGNTLDNHLQGDPSRVILNGSYNKITTLHEVAASGGRVEDNGTHNVIERSPGLILTGTATDTTII